MLAAPRRCLFVLAAMPAIGLAALFTVPMGVGVGAGLGDRVHDAAGERDRRVPRPDLRHARRSRRGSRCSSRWPCSPSWPRPYRRHHHPGPRLRHGRRRRPRGAVAGGRRGGGGGGLMTRRGLRRCRVATPRPLALVPTFRRADGAGSFVVFEGVEGAGKGTQIELARDFIESRGWRWWSRASPAAPSSASAFGARPGPDDGQGRAAGRGPGVRVEPGAAGDARSSAPRWTRGRSCCATGSWTRRSPTRAWRAGWASRTS